MLKCPFHRDCSYPCPVEALLHLEIQAMQTRNPKLLAALRRGGRRGGQAHSGEKMVPTAKTLIPKAVRESAALKTAASEDAVRPVPGKPGAWIVPDPARERKLLTLVPALSTTAAPTKTSSEDE